MSESIVVACITGIISLIGVVLTGKSTSDKVTAELEKTNALQNAEIQHIKDDITDLKADIKEHNHYAKLFAETMPVIKEQIKVANHRIEDLERNSERIVKK